MAEARATAPEASRRRIIDRPRLTRLLDESPARIKMLVAPAGYGKTTLARQWLASTGRTAVWVRCSRGDDIAAIAGSVAEAVGTLIPGAERRVLQRLPMTGEGTSEAALLAEMLAEEANRWPSSAWIVIDDYERLAGSSTSEAFVAGFIENPEVQTLILTRTEPGWLTAKQIMYGDVTVLDRLAIAMTPEEVQQLLPRVPDDVVIELARGWAAVLGLLAMSSAASTLVSTDLLTDNLARFIAEELYEGLSDPVRTALWKIAAADTDEESVVRELLGADAVQLLRISEAAGWVARDVPGRIDIHPLLKRFLIDRVEAPDHSTQPQTVETMVNKLIQSLKWDEAFALVERYHLTQIFDRFLRAALHPALAGGRTASVKRWMTFGAETASAPAIVSLARAEIAYREGRFVEAEALALAAANDLPERDHMLFHALFLAGRAAHTGTRPGPSLAHYRAARRLARDLDQECRAAFGEIGVAADLELPEAIPLLEEVRGWIPPDRPDLLTVWISRSLWCDVRFARPIDLDAGRWGYQLLSQVDDALSRTAFRNIFSYMLIQAGAIDEAHAVLAAQRQEATSLRLNFVGMYADHVDALLELTVGNLSSADERLKRLEHDALAAMDDFLLANVIAFRARLLLASGRMDDAIAVSFKSHGSPAKGMAAEIQGSRALAYACAGRGRDALAEADASTATSQSSEVLVLKASTLAIVAILEGRPDSSDLAEKALSAALHYRMIEPFLTACRGCPELCALLFRSDERRTDLRRLLAIATDLARYEPRPAASEAGTWRDLSPRQQDVLSLIAKGMSNREIAKHLYISEATAKVHVRHILEKLGVRSRTEAALRAPPGATPRSRE